MLISISILIMLMVAALSSYQLITTGNLLYFAYLAASGITTLFLFLAKFFTPVEQLLTAKIKGVKLAGIIKPGRTFVLVPMSPTADRGYWDYKGQTKTVLPQTDYRFYGNTLYFFLEDQIPSLSAAASKLAYDIYQETGITNSKELNSEIQKELTEKDKTKRPVLEKINWYAKTFIWDNVKMFFDNIKPAHLYTHLQQKILENSQMLPQTWKWAVLLQFVTILLIVGVIAVILLKIPSAQAIAKQVIVGIKTIGVHITTPSSNITTQNNIPPALTVDLNKRGEPIDQNRLP